MNLHTCMLIGFCQVTYPVGLCVCVCVCVCVGTVCMHALCLYVCMYTHMHCMFLVDTLVAHVCICVSMVWSQVYPCCPCFKHLFASSSLKTYFWFVYPRQHQHFHDGLTRMLLIGGFAAEREYVLDTYTHMYSELILYCCLCMHACVCMLVYIFTHVYTFCDPDRIWLSDWFMPICDKFVFIYSCMCVCVCVCVCMYVCMYVCMCVCVYAFKVVIIDCFAAEPQFSWRMCVPVCIYHIHSCICCVCIHAFLCVNLRILYFYSSIPESNELNIPESAVEGATYII
jgi:hypothetical protein